MPAAANAKGLKRICMNCGMRFYDLNATPIICPSCNTEYTGEAKIKTRKSRVAADIENQEDDDALESLSAKTTEDEDDIDAEEDEDEVLLESDDDDIVSLDDVDDDDTGDLDDDDDLGLDDDIDLDLDDEDDAGMEPDDDDDETSKD